MLSRISVVCDLTAPSSMDQETLARPRRLAHIRAPAPSIRIPNGAMTSCRLCDRQQSSSAHRMVGTMGLRRANEDRAPR